MRKVWMGLGLIAVMTTAGCGAEEAGHNSPEEQVDAEGTLEMITVEIITSETAEPGDEVRLAAEVVQGTEAVADADEVMFEVWKSGRREQGEMIEGIHTENGIYEASRVFEEKGLYFIQAHTSARGLHIMPQQEITVGNPDSESIESDGNETGSAMENMENHLEE
ncbi:FixH family protein [Planococcus lenghuensis]|uniref:YtkA-like domain-containing protein n=1 Tax=Planococcus lenghuensis TaxID=2213202 RepID=A0A1Q2KXM7_9BACL|nr:FixH family protein [Planococcus lenghuensis]AQQ52567.1 hypothetical protein B0X71_05290 [Planococcus lenghuensis]